MSENRRRSRLEIMKSIRVLAAAVLRGAIAGCSSSASGGGGTPSSSVAGSCTFSISQTCVDFQAGWTAQTAPYACVTPGVFSTSACTRTGVVGGCVLTSGGATHTTWHYSGTVATVTTSCMSESSMYVGP